MTIAEDIKKLRQNGMAEQEIIEFLKQKRVSPKEIENALSQEQIREAVMAPSPNNEQEEEIIGTQEYRSPALQNSMINEAPEAEIPGAPTPYPEQSQEQQPYSAESYPMQSQGYGYNYQYQAPLSSDTITEIAEQVVSEKLAKIRTHLEKTIDLKNMTEANLSHLDERLQRIEKIIDQLQLNILQKIGEHVINVSDLKKELIETQKSFKSVAHKHHPSEENHERHHPYHKK